MKIAIVSPCNLNDIWEAKDFPTRPVPWTHNLAQGLSQIESNEIHIISGISPKIKLNSYYIKKNNIYYHFFKHSGRFSPYFFYLYEVYKVRKILRKINPDIVHGQGLENYCGLSSILSSYPNVVTIHGILNEIFIDKGISISIRKYLERVTIRFATNIITLNPYVYDIIHKYDRKANNKNYFCIPNAVSNNFFTVKKNNKKKVRILYSGVFRARKGLLDLLKALKKIPLDNYKIFITGIIGKDTESQIFLKKVQEFCKEHLPNNSEVIGYVNTENMPKLMSQMDFLVLPSKAETAPMVISEAMACGLPVIAYDVGGIKYMIEDGKSGFVIPLDDVNMLKDRIEQLITKPDLCRTMGKRSKVLAVKKYNVKTIAKQTIYAYKKILG